MEELLHNTLTNFSLISLLVLIAVSLYTLGKGADLLVDEAVTLSVKSGIPKMIIGATIVSLGTTLPEATISVFAAIEGNPDLALGNAIGSIIADTGLIIGLAAIIGTLPIDRKTISRQGRIQLGSGLLLAIMCLPFLSKGPGGTITQWMGIALLFLLVFYIYSTISWAKSTNQNDDVGLEVDESSMIVIIGKLLVGVVIVIISSKILIPAVEITALRAGIKESVIAATLVAFGTSLPELTTAITAVRKGHGELAVGNIMGADILNVLFVVGAAAAVTTTGLHVPINFYYLQIPTMLIILIAFRIFGHNKGESFSKLEGIFLLLIYTAYIVLNYTVI